MNSRVIITNYSGKTEKLTIREHIPLHCQGHMLLLTFEMDRPRLQLYSKNDPDPHVLLAFLFFHATSFRKVYQNSVSQCFWITLPEKKNSNRKPGLPQCSTWGRNKISMWPWNSFNAVIYMFTLVLVSTCVRWTFPTAFPWILAPLSHYTNCCQSSWM